MPIYIKKIQVRNLGPIPKLEIELSTVNLIYGFNESGKTFLTEFIIRALFRDYKNWGYIREIQGRGKVIVSGVGDSDIEFTYGTSNRKTKKLDDLLENIPFITSSLARILIVKNGDVNIGDVTLSKSLLLELFSRKKIFDLLIDDRNIPKTIKEVNFINGEIQIANRGEGREYFQLKKSIEDIENKIKRLLREYNPRKLKDLNNQRRYLEERKRKLMDAKRYKSYKISEEVKQLRSELEKLPEEDINVLKELINSYRQSKNKYKENQKRWKELNEKIEILQNIKSEYEKQLKAKRYLAYKISESVNQLKKEQERYSEEELSEISIRINDYFNKKREYEDRRKQRNIIEEKIKYLEWLKSASRRYNELIHQPLIKPVSSLYISLSLLFLLLSFSFILVGIKIFSFFTLMVGIYCGTYYVTKMLKAFKDLPKNNEIENIKREFKEYFGFELRSLPDIDSKLRELEIEESRWQDLKLDVLEEEIKSIGEAIKESIRRITGEIYEEISWKSKLDELRSRRKELEREISEKEKHLAILNVSKSEYEMSTPGVKFDKDRFRELEEEVNKLPQLKEQIEKIESENRKIIRQMDEYFKKIQFQFNVYFREQIKEEDWDVKILEIQRRIRELRGKIDNKEGELRGLEIDPSDYLTEDPGVKYSKIELERIENEIKRIEKRIRTVEISLQSLKSSICSITGDDITIDWNELIKKFFTLKEEKYLEFKRCVSKIIAGKLVYHTVESLRSKEEELLIEAMNSKECQDVIKQITGKYKEFKIEGGDIFISDGFSDFDIKDISTGAKEQILIALRVGIVKKLLRTEGAFLILDDAIQHVDWERRPLLVKTLIELSKNNWQIIYLTMDNNIREIFQKKTDQLGGDFKFIDLNEQGEPISDF